MFDPASEAGQMPAAELIYRKVFDDQKVDKGLLPVLTAEVFKAGDTVADLGASLGGYSTFFNQTGLVQAFAFDGAHGIAEVTDGAVLELSLDRPFTLWRRFDWVLCLEVLEHIPPENEAAALSNLRRHARKGAVVSWASDWSMYSDPLHVNGKSDADVQAAMAGAGFKRDEGLTRRLRGAAEIWWLAENVAAYHAV